MDRAVTENKLNTLLVAESVMLAFTIHLYIFLPGIKIRSRPTDERDERKKQEVTPAAGNGPLCRDCHGGGDALVASRQLPSAGVRGRMRGAGYLSFRRHETMRRAIFLCFAILLAAAPLRGVGVDISSNRNTGLEENNPTRNTGANPWYYLGAGYIATNDGSNDTGHYGQCNHLVRSRAVT